MTLHPQPYQAGLHGRCVDLWFTWTGSRPPSFQTIAFRLCEAAVVGSAVIGFLALVFAWRGA